MMHTAPKLDHQIVVRVQPDLREKLETAAEREGRSLANLTRRILETWVQQEAQRAA